ncbi:hypothetical protein D3C80_1591150 [compost metagenome]
MNAYHLFHRHGKGVERVVVTQILFGGVGEQRQIAQLLQIARVNAGLIELALIHRYVVVGMVQGPLQAFQL